MGDMYKDGFLKMTPEQYDCANEGDYVLDGLLYCGKCHTPRQCRIEIMGRIRTPMCLCKCETEKRKREEEERKRQDFLDSIKRMRMVGFPDSEMKEWTFANDDQGNPKMMDIGKKFVENFPEMKQRHKGLLIYGSVGTGKTYMAASIANALIDHGYPCLVTNFARLVNTIQGMMKDKQAYMDSLDQFDLLVIDDLGAERSTEYMDETIQNIIDARYRSGKPLIVTTNLTINEISNAADLKRQRTYSRLLEMCVPIQFDGKDRRREKAKSDFHDMIDLLGIGG